MLFGFGKKKEEQKTLEKQMKQIEENTKKISSMNESFAAQSAQFIKTTNTLMKMFD